jgi:hypothetical protein
VFTILLACSHPVDIAITGAEISPTMANGAAWDGPDNVPPETRGLASALLAQIDPSGQLGSAVMGTVDTLVLPDPAGTVVLYPGPEMDPRTIVLPPMQDTLTPTWTASPATTFGGVSLAQATLIRLTLVDKDLQTDDPIGTVELSSKDLVAAERAGEPFAVDVSAQASGQVRTVSVLVTKTTVPGE